MSILEEVESPGAGVDEYVENLASILTRKLDIVNSLRNRLGRFKSHLDAEESLTNSVKFKLKFKFDHDEDEEEEDDEGSISD